LRRVAEEKKKPPFYEQRWFQGTAAVVALLGAVWAVSAKLWDAGTELTATEVARANTQIILDASAGMGEPFGEGTKLDAAVEAIRKYVVPLEEEGLSLRRTGRSCEEGGELLVGFGKDHADDVAEEAARQKAEGESSLGYAVIEAITEFTSSDRFQGPASTRQVIVITGAADDECLGGAAAAEISRKLDSSGIDATFKMVALKPSQRTRERLDSFAAALGEHAEVEFVETEEELEEVVQDDLQRLSAEIDLPIVPEEAEATETTKSGEAESGGESDEASGGGEAGPSSQEEGGAASAEDGAAPEEGAPAEGEAAEGSSSAPLESSAPEITKVP
jgi:hypothetical protein